MKALTDRLDWLKLYINGELGDRAEQKNITFAQDILIELLAIADVLPDIEARVPVSVNARTADGKDVVISGWVEQQGPRLPPERVIELPE